MDYITSNPSAQKIAAAAATGAALLGAAALLRGGSRAPASYSIQMPGSTTEKPGEGLPRTHRLAAKGFITTMPGITTLNDFITVATQKFASSKCIGVRSLEQEVKKEKEVNGVKKTFSYYKMSEYKWITYGEFGVKIADFAAGLVRLGLSRGDTLSIFEETRIEWTLACQAAFRQGMSILTVYANLGESALVYSLNLSKTETLLCNGQNLKIVLKKISELPTIKRIIFTDKADEASKAELEKLGVKVVSFASVEEDGRAHPVAADPPKPTDTALCMFTSGTTGNPKGVMLTHQNVVASIAACLEVLVGPLNVTSEDIYVNVLPLAHILAFVIQYVAILLGVKIGYATVRTLRDEFMHDCQGDLKELKPTIFLGVPTIFERIKKAVDAKIAELSPAKRAIFNTAVALKRYSINSGVPIPLVDRVFAPMRAQLGGRVRIVLCGGAALHPDIQDFLMTCIGCTFIQGYGLTETCGPCAAQEPTDVALGSIGSPIPCLEFKLVDVPEMGYTSADKPNPRGEICIRGASLFGGYLHNEEETKKAIDSEGWFHTGDIGMWAPNGTIRLIDRVKNLIKPPHGEYIALEKLESIYRQSSWVDNIIIYVDNHHNDCLAIIVPNRGEIDAWAHANGHAEAKLEDLCANKQLNSQVLKALQQIGFQNGLRSIEMVRAVLLTPEEWTPENGMLTAAQKVKRKPIADAHQEEINTMYKDLASRE